MKKRTLSVILAIVLTFALSVPAFATTYSDLTGHWAKTDMENLAAKGYIVGYSDGTMQPDKAMAAGEVLVVLSRLYALTDLETQLIQADYEPTVKGIVSSGLSWEYKNLEICLAVGIITKDELKSLSLTADIQKQQLALYLVRAMQLSSAAENLASTKLTFGDASKVLSVCVGSVAELKAIGIVSGDASNNFSPQSSVSRAVAATMVSRALTYMSSNSTVLTIPAYADITQNTGIITAASTTVVDIQGFNGIIREYALTSDANVAVNNVASTLSATYVGCYATINDQKGVVKSIAIVRDSSVTWSQGVIFGFSTSSYSGTLSVKNLGTSNITAYSISSTAAVTLDGVTSALANLANNEYVTLKCQGGIVQSVYAVSGITSLTGTVTSLTIASTITLKVVDANGSTCCFTLNISNLPTIKRGDKTITIDKMKVGNQITISYSSGIISLITVAGTGTTVSGTLTSSTTTADGTKWVVTANGVATTYALENGVSVYSGTTAIKLTDINVGDQVSIVVYNDTITDITQTSTTASTKKVNGTVLMVDTTNRRITMQIVSNKLIYIDTSTLVTVIVGSTGYTTYATSIQSGSIITVYGSYTDSSTFTAKTIVIE